MSPARSGSTGSRRNSPGSFKPYTRGITPIVGPQTPQQQQSSLMEGFQDMNLGTHIERPGFPTLAQYKMVEANYIQSLTPRRQGKALISQAMFDRIWDVLHQPDCQSETAQFRFWARKMFTISKTHRVTLGGGADAPDGFGDGPQEVLLHDNLLVAIQEQLYDLLCYCHGSTGHGGRDKTCALIRKHYTWVPKDLVSNFIKACPTCIMKKCGGIENAAMAQSQILQQQSDARNSMMSASDAGGGDMSLPAIRDYFPNLCSPDPDSPGSSNNRSPWSPIGHTSNSSRDSPLSPLSTSIMDNDFVDSAYRDANSTMSNRTVRSPLSGMISGPAVPPQLSRGMNGLPMSREVSLYKGIPNGWQFRHDTFAAAHAEFMRTKELATQEEADIGLGIRSNRPRIPSVAPLWGPNDFPGGADFDHQLDEVDLNDAAHSISPLQQYASSDPNDVSNFSLQYLLMGSPQDRGQKQQTYTPQIDPALLALSNQGHDQANQDQASVQMSNENGEHGDITSSANFASSNSIARRVMIPPRLNLQTLPTEKTLEALLAYRDNGADGSRTPDSPPNSGAWHLANPSPVSSISSFSSQISAFPTMTRSATTTVSPASSSLPTPVDEVGKEGPNATMAGGDMTGAEKVHDRMAMDERTTYDLTDGIQVNCGI